MATQVQFRGGSTSEHSTFTGAAREITVDTTLNTVVVHDGSTAGGHPLANKHNPSFTGNVGIGTNNPAYPLEVKRSSAGGVAAFTGSTDGGRPLKFISADNGIFLGAQWTRDIESASGIHAWSISGSERMRITSAGNVGIGTSSPSSLLSLYAGANSEYFRGGGNGVTTRDLVISASTGTNAGDTHTINASGSSGQLILATASSPRVTVDSSGNVGIGSAAPQRSLHVSGTSTNIARLENTSADVAGIELVGTGGTSSIFRDSGNLRFYPDGTERLRITSAGNVGIGTSAPGTALHVVTSGAGAIRHADGTRAVEMGSNGSTSYIGSITSGQDLALYAAGGEKARIDSAGNVGIGTSGGATGFGNVLRQKASGGASGYFAEGSNSDTWLGLYSGTSTGDSSALFFPSTGSFRIGSTTATGTTGYSEKLRITSDGKVGIGTSNPGTKLTVNVPNGFTTAANTFSVNGANSTGFYVGAHHGGGSSGCDLVSRGYATTQGDFVFTSMNGSYANPVERMRIKTNGLLNVGNTPVYADNTAALAGGLVAGDIYRKSDGTLMITF